MWGRVSVAQGVAQDSGGVAPAALDFGFSGVVSLVELRDILAGGRVPRAAGPSSRVGGGGLWGARSPIIFSQPGRRYDF